MALTKVTSGVRTLGTGEVATANMAVDPTNASNLASGTVPEARMPSTGTSWQAVQTTGFTAVAGNGYPVNTTSGGITITLPASASVGDTIEFVDYAGTFQTNTATLAPNGLKLEGQTNNRLLQTKYDGIRVVYLDATQGWHQAARGEMVGAAYPSATGPDGAAGVTDGDYKVHIFNASKTGSNGFSVSEPGTSAGSTAIEYLVIAGGGAGAQQNGGGAGGGGAGGYRNSCTESGEKSGRDTAVESTTTVTAQNYDVTIGAGASGAAGAFGATGSNSVALSITSLGGGGGGSNSVGKDGGSGGGGGEVTAYVESGDGTAGQGFDGYYGTNSGNYGGGGGGAGGTNTGSTHSRNGGAGLSSKISNISAPVVRGGGGGASGNGVAGGSAGTGGGGAGGAGSGGTGTATSGTANTGGGSGGWYGTQSFVNGGSGIVVIRYKFQN